jgi:hypothetical protein
MNVLCYDLIIAVVLVVFLVLGAKRGLILSLCGMAAILVALIGGTIGARALAPQVAASLEPRFAAAIEEQLDQELSDSLEDGRADFQEHTLTGILGFLSGVGLYQDLADAVEQAMEQGMTHVAAAAAARIAASLAETVAFPLIFLLFFILILLGWTLLSHLLNLAFRFPVLSTVNRVGGAALGLVKGVVIVFLAVWLLRRFSLLPLPEEQEGTLLLRLFAGVTPLSLFLP